MGEFDAIERLFLHQTGDDGFTEVFNGDDASVHHLPLGESLVVSCDSSIGGVHWPHDFDLQQAADRAVQAALSDLAAMGAQARWCWVALMATDSAALETMGRGSLQALSSVGVQLAGGDCVRADHNGLTVTVAGSVVAGTAMCRSEAQAGDTAWLLGRVGWAAAGLRQWQSGARNGEWIDAFGKVKARLDDGLALRQMGVSCCIDVSDGLLQDANRLAQASGVRLILQADQLPGLESLVLAWDDGLDLALSGGEDYALLCCASPKLDQQLLALGALNIGMVEDGHGVEVSYQQQVVKPKSAGFDHFSSAA